MCEKNLFNSSYEVKKWEITFDFDPYVECDVSPM